MGSAMPALTRSPAIRVGRVLAVEDRGARGLEIGPIDFRGRWFARARQRKPDHCAVVLAILRPDPPTVFFDDDPRERQPDSESRCLGREQWLENLFQSALGYADARVANGDLD